MKGTLRRIFADRGKQSSNSLGPTFKEEPVFIAKIDDDEVSAFVSTRGVMRSRGNFRKDGIGRPYQPRPSKEGRNPLDKNGRRTTCATCGSRNQWVAQCPNNEDLVQTSSKDKRSGNDPCYLTFATISWKLLGECHEKGILDSACTATGAGETWFDKNHDALLPIYRKTVFRQFPKLYLGEASVFLLLKQPDCQYRLASSNVS